MSLRSRITPAASVLAAAIFACGLGGLPAAAASEGADLIGKRLPDWGDLHFLTAPARRSPADFAGRVLVIRFWTSGCPFCEASAPVLDDWAHRYRDQGLTVIGIFHPKPPAPVTDRSVLAAARRIGLDCVLASDPEWSALDRLWLRGEDRAFTSATLLVDREGIVRAVHRGGFLSQDGNERETGSECVCRRSA